MVQVEVNVTVRPMEEQRVRSPDDPRSFQQEQRTSFLMKDGDEPVSTFIGRVAGEISLLSQE